MSELNGTAAVSLGMALALAGDRIAQVVKEKLTGCGIETVNLRLVVDYDNLDTSGEVNVTWGDE